MSGIMTMNGVNAAKGLQGTSRTQAATFSGLGAQLQAPPQGMSGPMLSATAPQGSSYTAGAGMGGGTSRYAHLGTNLASVSNSAARLPQSDSHGVVAGQGQQANVGQAPPRMTPEEMQDPANAAMAGYQYAAGNDRMGGDSGADNTVGNAPPGGGGGGANALGRPDQPGAGQGPTYAPQLPEQPTLTPQGPPNKYARMSTSLAANSPNRVM